MEILKADYTFLNNINNYKPNDMVQARSNIMKSPTDTVSLSVEGEQISAQSINHAFSDDILNIAKNDPQQAKEFAQSYAYGNDLLALDIPESGRLDETYYRDGTSFLNSKYKTDFESEARQYRQARIDLYETEKSNGSSDFEILQNLFDFYDNLPSSYQTKIGYI